jgi:Protein of unknown function (DUF1501)
MNQRKFLERLRSGKQPASRHFFFNRPHLSRRHFFQLAGAGVTGSLLAPGALQAGEVVTATGASTINKARNVIFILLAGAPSHVDTFDFKQSPSTPMDVMQPETINGIVFPTGLMPRIATKLDDIAIVRGASSKALQHNLAQDWTQIGRSPAAVLGDVAPNAGSIVALEKESERKPGQVFPTFLALNSQGAVGSGYFPTTYEPLRIIPANNGLPDTTHNETGGQTRFESRYNLLNQFEGDLRTAAPNGQPFRDMAGFYEAGKAMMYNPIVDAAFRFTNDEAARYGNSGFGNACLTASKALAANGGTRYIMITLGGWDHHQDIYLPVNLPRLAAQFDAGLAALIDGLKASGQFAETLIVVQGEFGRTPGPVTFQAGRDHFMQQFVLFAGAGIRGGRALGSTDATGSATREYAWEESRDFKPEDTEATIYSALGIDWTTTRYDDPFGRGFEYVQDASKGTYKPLHELWS